MKNSSIRVLFVAIFLFLMAGNNYAQKKDRNTDKNTYYYYKVLNKDFNETIVRVKEALKEQGFGVVSEINMQEKITKATGKEMAPYVILGACNPQGAYEAVQIDGRIGLLLPCNVIVRDLGNDRVEVASINPEKSMETAGNKKLEPLAKEIGARLKQMISNL